MPVGTPLPGNVTRTEPVKVSGTPEAEGFALDFTAVVVAAWPTDADDPGEAGLAR
jgi:hypothetical protein